jgi:transcription elongation factor S-II
MEEVRGLVKALTKADQPEQIADVLRALAKAPVTVPILHELKCGAVVSKLRKHEHESVSTEAKLLIKQWKGLAAAAGVPQTSKAPAPPAKTHSFAVEDLGDPTRQAARKKLQATLGEDASDADSYPAAEAVELALHRKWPNLQQPDQKRDYVAKLRQLSFNLKKNSELRSDVNSCAEIKILRRVRAESSRRPPRHRHDACSMAW